MRIGTTSLAALLALPVVGLASPGAAQVASTPKDTVDLSSLAIINGIVTGTAPTDRLAEALVYVPGQPYSAVTDSTGQYALPIPEGLWMVTVFHPRAAEMGLEQPPTALVTATMGSTVRLDFTLDPDVLGTQTRPYALEAMEVVVRATARDRIVRQGARVDALDPAVLEDRRPTARHVGDLIAGQFLGVRVRQYAPDDICIEAPRAAMTRTLRPSPTACAGRVTVVLDGMVLDNPGGWLVGLSPQAIERVEFMPAFQASTRFGRYAANGVLFIYTR